METRVGVRSGGGSRLEGAQSFFDVLRLILDPAYGQFLARQTPGLRFYASWDIST